MKKNKDEHDEVNKTWRMNNKERLAQTKSRYVNSTPERKMAATIRSRIWTLIRSKGFSRCKKYREYIGCTGAELKIHIESQFKPGMTWENHGEWHIDHIIPLVSAKIVEELYNLNHYSNLQPLWATENLSKGDKINVD